MSPAEVEAFLASDDHAGTAILAVARPERGPLLVPLAFRFEGGSFEFDTKPSRRHARAFEAAGRATVIVHHERYAPGVHLERYVTAEGPIGFIEPRPADDEFGVAVLTPRTLVGVVYDLA
jgi:nitroimidazol reductase NimA-like FMN-containing flavoprotein (pyridoxamine 5'-phosphate oxidase superfamily)